MPSDNNVISEWPFVGYLGLPCWLACLHFCLCSWPLRWNFDWTIAKTQPEKKSKNSDNQKTGMIRNPDTQPNSSHNRKCLFISGFQALWLEFLSGFQAMSWIMDRCVWYSGHNSRVSDSILRPNISRHKTHPKTGQILSCHYTVLTKQCKYVY